MITFRQCNLSIRELPEGLLIEQKGRAYLARRWSLTDEIASIINLAIKQGLNCLIQDGHPQDSKLRPHGNGADYISFSAHRSHRWTFVLDMDSGPRKAGARGSAIEKVKFNRAYKHYLRASGIACPPEWRSPRHLEVAIDDLEHAIRASKPHWESLGPKIGKAGERGTHAFFVDEEDLHAHILRYWEDIPVLNNWELLASKHLLGSIHQRQAELDIIAATPKGSSIIIELKNQAVFNTGGETPEKQLSRYMTHPEFLRKFGEDPQGVLIAQSIDLRLAAAVRGSVLPMIAFEVTKTSQAAIMQEVARSDYFRSDI